MKTPSIKNLFLEMQEDNLPAIYSSQETITYGELKNKVNKVLRSLIDLDVGEGDHVAILGGFEPEIISIIVAIWKLGAVPVPLNTRLSNRELNELISISDCKLILVSSELQNKNIQSDVESIEYPFNDPVSKGTISNDFIPQFTSTAVIIFSSGSTGKPKAVEISFKGFIESAKTGNKILMQTENDKWLASLPFYHIGGFSILARSLLHNTSLILPESNSVEDIISAIDLFHPTLCSLVPTQLRRLINFEIPNVEKIRHVLIGGGFSSEDLILAAYKQGWNVVKVYGSTETTAFVTALSGDEILYKPKSAGKAISPNIIKIINDKGIEVIEGEVGEIIINTPAIMKGYYKNDAEYKKCFKSDFYLSGDLGYLDEEGFLYIEARRTDMIVTGGENVNVNEIEILILDYPDIEEAAVFPLPDEEWGQVVTAAIKLKNNKNELPIKDLNDFLSKELADFKLVRKLFIVKEIPKTDLGKTDRKKLIENYRL